MAYGGAQARGGIGAVATGLRQSHSNVGSEQHLQPTPQLMAMPDPEPTEQGQGSDASRSCDLHCRCGNAGSFIPPVPGWGSNLHPRAPTMLPIDPTVPQQDLP